MSERYCDEHRRDVVKNRNKDYDDKRRNRDHDRFYHSAEWKIKRDAIMKWHGGLCVMCEQNGLVVNADVVDHIVPIGVDWSLRLDGDNLQPLCHACHAVKTAEDKKRYGEGGVNSCQADDETPTPLSYFYKI
jgi:5-methylcytosine-specific restriction protein A